MAPWWFRPPPQISIPCRGLRPPRPPWTRPSTRRPGSATAGPRPSETARDLRRSCLTCSGPTAHRLGSWHRDVVRAGRARHVSAAMLWMEAAAAREMPAHPATGSPSSRAAYKPPSPWTRLQPGSLNDNAGARVRSSLRLHRPYTGCSRHSSLRGLILRAQSPSTRFARAGPTISKGGLNTPAALG